MPGGGRSLGGGIGCFKGPPTCPTGPAVPHKAEAAGIGSSGSAGSLLGAARDHQGAAAGAGAGSCHPRLCLPAVSLLVWLGIVRRRGAQMPCRHAAGRVTAAVSSTAFTVPAAAAFPPAAGAPMWALPAGLAQASSRAPRAAQCAAPSGEALFAAVAAGWSRALRVHSSGASLRIGSKRCSPVT